MRFGNNKGFTLVELLIVVATVGILVFGVGFCGAFLMGNYWTDNDASTLRCVKEVDPTMTTVVKVERHVFTKTIVTANDAPAENDLVAKAQNEIIKVLKGSEAAEPVTKKFGMDTNILQNAVCTAD